MQRPHLAGRFLAFDQAMHAGEFPLQSRGERGLQPRQRVQQRGRDDFAIGTEPGEGIECVVQRGEAVFRIESSGVCCRVRECRLQGGRHRFGSGALQDGEQVGGGDGWQDRVLLEMVATLTACGDT